MKTKQITKETKRLRRRARVRSQVSGTAKRPRLSVFRSLTNVFVQLIDDSAGKTLASIHSKTLSGDAGDRKGKVAKSYLAGLEIAKKAKELGVETIVFDRGGYQYHGRVSAVADGARDGGLKF